MAHVLIVEDEWLIATQYVALMRRAGHSVVGPFARVEPALEAIEANRIDVGLLDVNLAAGTSLPIAHLLQTRGIPFAFLTGHAGKKVLSSFEAIPILSKPVMPEDLLTVLGELLPSRPAS